MSCLTSFSAMIVSLGPAQMTGLNGPRNDPLRNGGGGRSQCPPALAMWLSRSYDADWQKVALSQLVEFVWECQNRATHRFTAYH